MATVIGEPVDHHLINLEMPRPPPLLIAGDPPSGIDLLRFSDGGLPVDNMSMPASVEVTQVA